MATISKVKKLKEFLKQIFMFMREAFVTTSSMDMVL